MKKIVLLSVMVLGSFLIENADAQLRVNVNIGLQPIWGPVGYDYVEYYYIPDLDIYYHVPTRQYVIPERGRWIFVNILPRRFRNADLFRMNKIVINETRPFLNHNYYKDRYSYNRGRFNQELIRDSRDARYFANENHPLHRQWERDRNRPGERNGTIGENDNNRGYSGKDRDRNDKRYNNDQRGNSRDRGDNREKNGKNENRYGRDKDNRTKGGKRG